MSFHSEEEGCMYPKINAEENTTVQRARRLVFFTRYINRLGIGRIKRSVKRFTDTSQRYNIAPGL